MAPPFPGLPSGMDLDVEAPPSSQFSGQSLTAALAPLFRAEQERQAALAAQLERLRAERQQALTGATTPMQPSLGQTLSNIFAAGLPMAFAKGPISRGHAAQGAKAGLDMATERQKLDETHRVAGQLERYRQTSDLEQSLAAKATETPVLHQEMAKALGKNLSPSEGQMGTMEFMRMAYSPEGLADRSLDPARTMFEKMHPGPQPSHRDDYFNLTEKGKLNEESNNLTSDWNKRSEALRIAAEGIQNGRYLLQDPSSITAYQLQVAMVKTTGQSAQSISNADIRRGLPESFKQYATEIYNYITGETTDPLSPQLLAAVGAFFDGKAKLTQQNLDSQQEEFRRLAPTKARLTATVDRVGYEELLNQGEDIRRMIPLGEKDRKEKEARAQAQGYVDDPELPPEENEKVRMLLQKKAQLGASGGVNAP